MRLKPLHKLLLALALWVAAGFLVVHECTYGGGMGASYKTCDCLGVDWEVYDSRPADGPRKTMCIGIVQSTTCYRMERGPVIECPR